ncbi:hypothetical protein [Dyadobacter sp. CY343]|uniref:hypothetical protein n=1 Tax=Dyadobacter sp. CY343 TaxID=2907299 RepID=UPI001F344653|nr:hypothetical protein [Dyadobacter sp. CY343]MCE7058706.1 hypothetical protein [Dyadobacter sp. CY343]
MKKYFFTCLVSLSFLAFSCAQKTSQEPGPIPGVPSTEEETPAETNTERLLPSQLPTIAYPMFVTGTTTYHSKLKPEAWFARPIEKADLGSLANPGKVPHMIAFGGGLTAGVSNGGLNREAQQFAYPNLVARQMGISDFKTPLLPEDEANGTGIFLYEDPKAEYPRWKEVTNNLAKLEAGQPVKMTPYEGLIHNFAYPSGGTIGVTYPFCPSCKGQAYSSRFSAYENLDDTYLLGDIQRKHDYDFVIIEEYFDGLHAAIINAARLDERSTGVVWNENRINPYSIEFVLNKEQKGVLFTIPHFKHLGFMNWYNVLDLKRKASSISMVYQTLNGAKVADGSKTLYLKPTPTVEGLFRTVEINKPLEGKLFDIDIIDNGEDYFMDPDKIYNPGLSKFASEHNLALVDLRKIYEQIHSGSYVTEDGMHIDGSMRGNFFSADGIYPTPVGQAVIANEVIKAINSKYGSRIPLINVTEFAKIVGAK